MTKEECEKMSIYPEEFAAMTFDEKVRFYEALTTILASEYAEIPCEDYHLLIQRVYRDYYQLTGKARGYSKIVMANAMFIIDRFYYACASAEHDDFLSAPRAVAESNRVFTSTGEDMLVEIQFGIDGKNLIYSFEDRSDDYGKDGKRPRLRWSPWEEEFYQDKKDYQALLDFVYKRVDEFYRRKDEK